MIFQLSKKIEKICNHLLIKENLYTTELSNKAINDNEISQWINELINIQAGYPTFNVEFEDRPVSLIPILKIQDKREYYEKQHNLGFRGEILQHLQEITFYINGSENGNNEYFKQTTFPLKDCQNLDGSKILSFIKNSRSVLLNTVNLVGNIFLYPAFEQLIIDIAYFSVQCAIHVPIQDLIDNLSQLKTIHWPEYVRFNLLVGNVFDVSLIRDLDLPFSITVFVFSENDHIELSTIFEDISENHSINFVPLYNNHNLSFFESNIFIDENDLDTMDLTKNDIFMRQALNITDFGKLTVMPDETVYANVNNPPLGTIDNSTYSLVYKEFMGGKSWLKIRDQSPCTECLYQWLCPSPSNYEIAIGKPNLCHVK